MINSILMEYMSTGTSYLANIGTPADPTRSGIASSLANTVLLLLAIVAGVIGGVQIVKELGKSGEGNQKMKNIIMITAALLVAEGVLGSIWYLINIAQGIPKEVV